MSFTGGDSVVVVVATDDAAATEAVNEKQYFTRDLSLDNCLAAAADTATVVDLTVDQRFIGDVGCVVWDAALVLAKYLDRQSSRLGLRRPALVVELGAGTGFCGLCAAALGARAVITDLADCVDLMVRNVNKNRLLIGDRVAVHEYDWAQTAGGDQQLADEQLFFGHNITEINYILISDCLYYAQSVRQLYDTVDWLSSKGATVLMSYEDRDDKRPLVDKFFKLIKSKFIVNEISSDELHADYRSPDLHLYN
ncbi:protein N-lysine methyltransferase METTL21D-like [Oppia nitens]|uniref:protein N-lysine methyltransferase METTL21D-like n=1 Tax=Oppia nitens TaxID=1686743 RepID=UPI0023DB343D|nr:protein N-lysine methyltransferase METTL21D-like [Oppia nitens]